MTKIKHIQLIRDGNIVGKCNIVINNDNDDVWLENVSVYKKYRGLGYSQYLVKKAINIAKK